MLIGGPLFTETEAIGLLLMAIGVPVVFLLGFFLALLRGRRFLGAVGYGLLAGLVLGAVGFYLFTGSADWKANHPQRPGNVDPNNAHLGQNNAKLEQAKREAAIAMAHQLKLGDDLRAKRDWDGALAAYREAILRWPDHWEAHRGLGFTLKELGQLDDAITAYRAAVRINPKDATSFAWLGFTAKDKGDHETAIGAFRDCLQLVPDYAPAHINLGLVLETVGDYDSAAAAFRHWARIEPKNASATAAVDRVLKLKAEREARTAPRPRDAKRP